jgi:hypothetical protein
MVHLSAAVVAMGVRMAMSYGDRRDRSHDFSYALPIHFFEEMHDTQKYITQNHL